jgi:hypothetical protein
MSNTKDAIETGLVYSFNQGYFMALLNVNAAAAQNYLQRGFSP